MIKLGNLVALRQIRIEIILAVEPAPLVDLRVDREPRADSLADALAIGHGQHARHCGIDEADLRVRLSPEGRGRAGEQLGLANDLRMDLKADHDLPVSGCATNAIARLSHSSVLKVFLRKQESRANAAQGCPGLLPAQEHETLTTIAPAGQ